MQIFHLIVSHLSCFLDSLLQVFYPRVSFFESIVHLLLEPIVLFLLGLNYFVLFFELSLKLLTLALEVIDNGIISIFNTLKVTRMQFCDALFDVVEL